MNLKAPRALQGLVWSGKRGGHKIKVVWAGAGAGAQLGRGEWAHANAALAGEGEFYSNSM